ncbi:MAG: molybdopterin molybdenumtransferase MoeA, partial [Parvibaculales bacterium]
MKSVSQARKEIIQSARPLEAESVPLEEALDRVIAKAERAKCTKPAHDVSAMDGFALNGGGKTWHIMGKIAAGDKLPSYRLKKGEAMHISTGAPLPKGADRILIKEDATLTAKKLTAKQTPKKDIYIRKKASDFRKGQKLFSKGIKLTPPILSLAAAAGISKLTLYRRPQIALLSNGNELVSLGTLPKPHQ